VTSSVTTRKIFFVARDFGVRACRIVSMAEAAED